MGHVIESDSQPQCNHSEKRIAIFCEGWPVICGRSASILAMDERKGLGVTHEKQGLCFLRLLSSVRSD